MPNIRAFIPILFFVFALTLVRIPGFFLPHNHGDQLIYTALAMQLDKTAGAKYSLRGADMKIRSDGHLFGLMPSAHGENGTLLAHLPAYYDSPLFHKPPLFSWLLVYSHRIFAGHDPAYPLIHVVPGMPLRVPVLIAAAPRQFYAQIVPFVFSITLIALTWMLGRMTRSSEAGLWAAAMIGFSALDILTAQRIWADDPAAVFTTAALILYVVSCRRTSLLWPAAAGLACAAAFWTKPLGALVWAALLGFEAARSQKKFSRWAVLFFAGCLPVFPWLWKIFQIYGSIWYIPAADPQNQPVDTLWYHLTTERSAAVYVLNPLVQTPLLVLAVGAFFVFFKRRLARQGMEERDLLPWCVLVYTATLMLLPLGRELRYLLPMYPLLAVMAAAGMTELKELLTRRYPRFAWPGLLAALGIISCGWSAMIGLRAVITNASLIRFPL